MKKQLIDFCDLLEKRGVNIPERDDVISQFIHTFHFDSKMKLISSVVIRHYGITEELICKKSNIRATSVEPRQVAMTLMVEHKCGSMGDIGRYFKDGQHVFDHATVLHAIKQIKNIADVDQKFKTRLDAIRADIAGLLK